MKTVKLTFLGDISFSGKNQVADNTFVGPGIRDVFNTSDAVIGNFESSICLEEEPLGLFQSKSNSAEILKNSGITHAFLANNHTYDYGYKGLKKTVEAIEKEGISPVGLSHHNGKDQRISSLVVNDVSIGLIGCGWTKASQGSEAPTQYWEYNEEEILSLIQAYSDQYDHLIVIVHKGKMFVEYPSITDRKAFKKYLKKGATAVICHHPHVIQGIDDSNDRLIAYSVGNFFFDSEEGHVQSSFSKEKQDTGIMVSLDLSKNKLTDYRVIPILKKDRETVLLPKKKAEDLKYHLKRISSRTRSSVMNSVFFSLQFIRFVVPHFFKVKLHHLRKN